MTHPIRLPFFGLLCLSVSLFVFSGCGTSDPRHKDLVPASGTVTYKGNPVDGAVITFFHEDPAKQGGGAISEADGTFTLKTYSGNGTHPGTYTVTVLKDNVVYPISDEEILRLEQEGKSIPEPTIEMLLPKKYRLKTTSDITITISPKGDKNLKIELVD